MANFVTTQTDELLLRYKHAAQRHGEATWNGDADQANGAYHEMERIVNDLKSRNALAELLVLQDDADRWVQLWAAGHTLQVDETRALTLLRRLEASGGLTAMTAHYTINSWYERKSLSSDA